MNRRTKELVATIMLLLILAIFLALLAVTCHAETVKRVSSSAISYTEYDGNSFIEGRDGEKITGLFRYRGRIYYGHRTGTFEHPVGSLAKNCFKKVDGDWYYFGKTGKAQRKDSHYIDIRHRNSTVRYIYTKGTHKRQRYNTRLARYQTKEHGRWVTVGMQCYPDGEMDLQR